MAPPLHRLQTRRLAPATLALLPFIFAATSTAANAHNASGKGLAKRNAAYGAGVVRADCALAAADGSVLGWRLTNLQGTQVGECWDSDTDAGADSIQRLVFGAPVTRVEVVSALSNKDANKKKKNKRAAVVLELAFTTADGKRHTCGGGGGGSSSSSASSSSSLESSARRSSNGWIVLRRFSASASKDRALSGLYSSVCVAVGSGVVGSGGSSTSTSSSSTSSSSTTTTNNNARRRAKPESLVAFFSPVPADGWWPNEDDDQGCGGGGGRCNDGGGGTSFPHAPTGAGARLAALLPKDKYVEMFPMLNDALCTGKSNVPAGAPWPYRNCLTRFCPAGTVYIDWEINDGVPAPYTGRAVEPYAEGMYDWETLIEAAESFSASFLAGADADTNKRELAAFLAQISHETTNGDAPTGGLCHREEGPGGDCSDKDECAAWPPPVGVIAGCCRPNDKGVRAPMPRYCQNEAECAPGKKYYGRGPKQLSYEYNYKQFGNDVGVPDLARDPDLLLRDRLLPFKSALWFWVTPQGHKPSCASVMQGTWVPTARDVKANRKPGFGTVTNIINGGVECRPQATYITPQQASRIKYYEHYCALLGVETGANLSCEQSENFNY
jgi:chitinase